MSNCLPRRMRSQFFRKKKLIPQRSILKSSWWGWGNAPPGVNISPTIRHRKSRQFSTAGFSKAFNFCCCHWQPIRTPRVLFGSKIRRKIGKPDLILHMYSSSVGGSQVSLRYHILDALRRISEGGGAFQCAHWPWNLCIEIPVCHTHTVAEKVRNQMRTHTQVLEVEMVMRNQSGREYWMWRA